MPLGTNQSQNKIKNTNILEGLNYLGRLPRKIINLTTKKPQLDTGAHTRSQGIISAY